MTIGRLHVIWWPRRVLFFTFIWPNYPEHLEVKPMFRAVFIWPVEFRWWFKEQKVQP